jgi:dipeptidyl-peptidase 4
VRDNWGATSLFEHYLAQEGFLVWSLDNRGSWGRGHAWETPIFKELGRRELEDQLAGIAYLKALPYVDGAKIGIWGGSYGGTMTLYALTHAPGIFKCGISLYPVTDWKYYDSIYTERYMRTPQENPEGYQQASLLAAASRLGSSLLLVHGTADDNVHIQNSYNFMDALIQAGKQFELQIYPGQKHGIRSEADKLHLNALMVDFLKKHLQGH